MKIPATLKQVAFIISLRAERGLAEFSPSELSTVSKADASAEITRLLALPKAGIAAAAAKVEVEPGYYCLEYQGILRFYAVKAGKGKWVGRTWVNRFQSDYQARISRTEEAAVRVAIAAAPEVARKRFAAEKTRCFSCARLLTDALSRSRGQGPDCFGR